MVPLIATLCLAPLTHRVVVEVNVPGTAAYGTVLGNVENLRKALAPDRVEVEVVCHGDGIRLLLANDARTSARVIKLAKSKVAFAACANTLRGRHIDRSRLFSFVKVVPSGVAEVVRKQEAGWSYLKGAY